LHTDSLIITSMDAVTCNLVEEYQHFRETCCFHLFWEHVSSKYRYSFTKLHGITSDTTVILIPPR